MLYSAPHNPLSLEGYEDGKMGIPDFQSIMLPLLKFAADQQEHSLREAIEILAQTFKLSDEERKELLPSGQQAIFDNRVGWARTYVGKAGLLENPRRSFFRITQRGLDELKKIRQKLILSSSKGSPNLLNLEPAPRKVKNPH